jgi:hypothetical protein
VKDSKINDIIYLQQPEAALHPDGELTQQELFLRGFKWIDGKRPLKMKDIFFW